MRLQHHLVESLSRRREGIDTDEVLKVRRVAKVANVGTIGTEGVVAKTATALLLRRLPL